MLRRIVWLFIFLILIFYFIKLVLVSFEYKDLIERMWFEIIFFYFIVYDFQFGFMGIKRMFGLEESLEVI